MRSQRNKSKRGGWNENPTRKVPSTWEKPSLFSMRQGAALLEISSVRNLHSLWKGGPINDPIRSFTLRRYFSSDHKRRSALPAASSQERGRKNRGNATLYHRKTPLSRGGRRMIPKLIDYHCPTCKGSRVYHDVKNKVMKCNTCGAQWNPSTRKLTTDKGGPVHEWHLPSISMSQMRQPKNRLLRAKKLLEMSSMSSPLHDRGPYLMRHLCMWNQNVICWRQDCRTSCSRHPWFKDYRSHYIRDRPAGFTTPILLEEIKDKI